MTNSDTTPKPPPRSVGTFFRTRAMRFFIMLVLIVLMTIPIGMVAFVVADRADYQQAAIREVSSQWGGRVEVKGAVFEVPVLRRVEREIEEEDGTVRIEEKIVAGEPLVFLPETADLTATSNTEIRHRGIFEIPVYGVDATFRARFDRTRAASLLSDDETAVWAKARLGLLLTGRSFFGETVAIVDGTKVDLEPGTPVGQPGVQVAHPFAKNTIDVEIRFGLNGAQSLGFDALARQTDIALTSDWPDPSFAGRYLPTEREITEDGFTARWSVPHLARNTPLAGRGTSLLDGISDSHYGRHGFGNYGFGVRLIQPVDFYQQTSRAVKYGVLFIALTFISVFLMERYSTRAVHPAQYILIGVAQTVFFLLLLSLSEQIGFLWAYLAAAGATVGLVTFYGASALRLGRRAWLLGGLLAALYGTLYLILQSRDYSILAGSILAFLAVAAAMIMTRNEDWYGPAETSGSAGDKADPSLQGVSSAP